MGNFSERIIVHRTEPVPQGACVDGPRIRHKATQRLLSRSAANLVLLSSKALAVRGAINNESVSQFSWGVLSLSLLAHRGQCQGDSLWAPCFKYLHSCR